MDSPNSWKQFEKTTLNMCVSNTGLWGCRSCPLPGSGPGPWRLPVFPGSPGWAEALIDLTGQASRNWINYSSVKAVMVEQTKCGTAWYHCQLMARATKPSLHPPLHPTVIYRVPAKLSKATRYLISSSIQPSINPSFSVPFFSRDN